MFEQLVRGLAHDYLVHMSSDVKLFDTWVECGSSHLNLL